MIYVVCATQVFTVFCVMVCVRWTLAYFADRDKGDIKLRQEMVLSFFAHQAEEQIKHRDQLKELIEEHRKDRELLLERIQHPQMTQGQAAGQGGETGSVIIDEESEAREEFGVEDVEEGEELHEVPTAVIGPRGPIKPVQAIGADDG